MTLQEEIEDLKGKLSEIYNRLRELEPNVCKSLHETEKHIIIEEVLAYTNKTMPDILGQKRHAGIVEARQLICWLLYARNKYSLYEIKDVINRHHATVLHSAKTIENMIETNKQKRDEYLQLKDRIFNLLNN